MNLNHKYLEKVYSGILGKLIPEERVFASLADSKAFIIDNKV